MQNRSVQIPTEAWPILDVLFNLTCAAAGIWLAITAFVLWRRAASNLTPVNVPEKNKRAQPDFLSVDKKARAEAIARGESFEDELDRRDRDEARQAARNALSSTSLTARSGRIAGWISFVLALFSLLTGALGVIFNVIRFEGYSADYGSVEKIAGLFIAYPIPSAVAVVIIILKIAHFIIERRTQKEG